MSRKNESLLNLLTRLPWWISISTAAVSYLAFRFILPALPIRIFGGNPFAQVSSTIAQIVAFFFVLAAGMSAFERWRKGRMLDSQKGIETVGSLSWKEFEELVSEIFRRQGYFVLENPGEGADGGVDLRLRKDGKKVYVQCKHWKAIQVGVKTVRELYGVMMANGADEGFVVSYGTFTREAIDFAKGKHISLVNGKKLMDLIRGVQKDPLAISGETAAKTCPNCGSEMVLRTAKKGAHAGEQFWGCTKFPECRAILRAVEGNQG